MAPGGPYELKIATYASLGPDSGQAEVGFCDTLDDPFVVALVSTTGSNITPTTVSGVLESLPGFTRGDCNADGGYDITDAIAGLESLFGGAGPPECTPACDANADGNFIIDDPIFVLNNLFQDGPCPPSAGQCQDDGCIDFTGCP